MKAAAICISAILLVFSAGYAQQSTTRQFTKHGIVRAQATISPGYMTVLKSSPVYLHGDLEYFLEEQISVRGDSYFYLTDLDDSRPFEYNHSSFAGVLYHFKKERPFDLYLGIQPGASFANANRYRPLGLCASPTADCDLRSEPSVDPLISALVGFNFFADKYFHLHMGARYIYGTHRSKGVSPISLQEIRFSFGLGFNLNAKKKKSTIKNPAMPVG